MTSRASIGAMLVAGLSLGATALAADVPALIKPPKWFALPQRVSTQLNPAEPNAVSNADAAIEPAEIKQLIVKYRGEKLAGQGRALLSVKMAARVDALTQRIGVRLRYKRPMSNDAHVLYLPQAMTARQAGQIAARVVNGDANVEYAIPDYIRRPSFQPNDPGFISRNAQTPPSQWNLLQPTDDYTYAPTPLTSASIKVLGGINVPSAWDVTKGLGVVVGVVDTGVTSHPDLDRNLVSETVADSGFDFVSDATLAHDNDGRDANPADPGDGTVDGECKTGSLGESSTWHGTHVAGVIAAMTDNQLGVAGIASQSRVLALRALGKCGGTVSDLADAIRWAAGDPTLQNLPANANPAKVINLSLGSSDPCTPVEQAAIDAARARGTLVIAATGNHGLTDQLDAPAACPGVMAVTAHNIQGDLTYYANIGSALGPSSTTPASSDASVKPNPVDSSIVNRSTVDGAGRPVLNSTALSAPGGGCGAMAYTVRSGFASCSGPNLPVWSTSNIGAEGPVDPTYTGFMGTSMAVPHVAGVAALLASMSPDLPPDTLRGLMTATARPFPAGTYCADGQPGAGRCGAGMLDADAAVKLLMQRQPSIDAGADQVVNSGSTVILRGSASVRSTQPPNSTTLRYEWLQTSGAAPVPLANPQSAVTSFGAPDGPAILDFELIATDENGYRAVARTKVSVLAPGQTVMGAGGVSATLPPPSNAASAGAGAATPANAAPGGGGGSVVWWNITLLLGAALSSLRNRLLGQ